MEFVGGILLLLIAIIIYFMPASVASNRLHMNRTSIMVLNLFLGWTLIGWLIALIWAYSANTEHNFYIRHGHPPSQI